ncbi:MAG: thiamine phosphate synthase [Deltaproteobacteria bacterium]|nr:thiamine phosphate synthase [Deltaproteobacteria bacterium]
MFCSNRDKREAAEKVKGLYPIMDLGLLGEGDVYDSTCRILEGGVGIIQLRAKQAGSKEMLEAATKMRRATESFKAVFIVNDRVDVAMLSGADGIHIGDSDLPPEDARELIGKEKLIGFSTHTKEEAQRAEMLISPGIIDYISFGPIFTTQTKPDAREAVGVATLKEVCSFTDVPVVAIGGITEDKIKEVMSAGPDSIAMISEIMKAHDKLRATTTLSAIITSATASR